MKIVIEIPDYNLESVQNGSIACGQILKAVRNGKPYEEKLQGEYTKWHPIVNGEDRPPEGKDVLIQVAESRFKIGHFCGIMLKQVIHTYPSGFSCRALEEYPRWFFNELSSIGDHDPIAWAELPKSYKEINNE